MERVLNILGVEITHKIPCMVPEDSPSLCVQIYGASGGGPLGLCSVDIVTQLIISRETHYNLRLVLLHGQDLTLRLPEDDEKQRIHGTQKGEDSYHNPVVVTLMTIPSRLPRTQPDTDN